MDNRMIIGVVAVVLVLGGGLGWYLNYSPMTPEPAPLSRTVIDSTGTEVTIPLEAERIVALRPMQVEMVIVLGAEEKLVGVDDRTQKGILYGELNARLRPELKELSAPVSKKTLNMEELIALEPDVVLLGGFGRMFWIDELKEVNLTVVVAHFEEIGNFTRDLKIIGEVVDKQERADEISEFIDSIIEEIQSKVSEIAEEDKVKAYFCSHDAYHVYGGLTFEHSQIVTAGGINVAEEVTAWTPEVSPEQLITWNPDVIFTLEWVPIDEILADERIQSVDAIKNGRVYSIPECGWDYGSLRSIFAIKWIAAKLYPDEFEGVNITQEANDFYQIVYGIDYEGPSLD